MKVRRPAVRFRPIGPRRLVLEAEPGGRNLPLRKKVALGSWFVLETLWFSDMMGRAGAMAYSFVFSLVPLVATTIAFFTAFPALESQRDRLIGFLAQFLLPGAVQGVQSYIERFSDRAAAAGAISSVSFVAVTLLVLNTLEVTFNALWKVPSARTWSRRIQLLSVALLLGAVSLTLFVVIEAEASKYLSGRPEFLSISPFLLACAFFTAVNKLLPNTRVDWLAALGGGLLAGPLWHFSKSAFTWYINNFADYSRVYGTLGAIPVFFLWTYISFLLLMIGSYVAFVIQNFHALVHERQQRERGNDASAFYCVMTAARLARAFHHGAGSRSAAEIAEELGVDPYFVARSLAILSSTGFAANLSPGSPKGHYLLARDATTVSISSLVASAIGHPLMVPTGMPPEKSSELFQRVRALFDVADAEQRRALDKMTLAELSTEAPPRDSTPRKAA